MTRDTLVQIKSGVIPLISPRPREVSWRQLEHHQNREVHLHVQIEYP
jgi:hypothetical protein